MIRPYKNSDQQQLIKLFQLNTPAFFAPEEEAEFIEYLEKESANYFVVEENKEIVGCGGFNLFEAENLARISWDIIHPNFQGKGIGKKLTLFRIEQIKKYPTINTVVVRTSQLVFKFYEKLDFKLVKTEKDFWAKGFDLYQMNYEL